MKVVLGSENISKKEAIMIAFNELGFFDVEVINVPVSSSVSSKPLNNDILIGAENRNHELINYCLSNDIDYDYLISIEGGFEEINNNYFIVSYACVYDRTTDITVFGKSVGLQITMCMFDCVRDGKSLNKAIEELIGNTANKKKNGISGYLTNGYYYRSVFDSTAVLSAMQCLKNMENYRKLDMKLRSKIL